MGWAKYDEDNRDAIEERLARTGHFIPSVYNYTSDYTSTQVKFAQSTCYLMLSLRVKARRARHHNRCG